MNLYTVGFTKKSAEVFFELLKSENIKTLIDVRLNNVSQLAGYTKRDDLRYFLKEICQIDYMHLDFLAPTKAILDGYKSKAISWKEYEEQFLKLLEEREVIKKIDVNILDNACLLCSEALPEQCHRRLVADYLLKSTSDFTVKHL